MEKSMGVPLEEVLNLPVLDQVVVLAGRKGLNRLVTSVNVMEVPDIADWVSKGELLITTAHSIKENVEVLTELIPWFNNAGVAGLGIKLKRFVDEIPQEAIDIAEKLSFPLFEIPAKVAFSEIITIVLTHIVNRQTNLLLEIQNLSRALTSIMLSGGNLQKISDLFFRRFGNSVAIVSDYFSSRVISTTQENAPNINAVLNEEKHQLKGMRDSNIQYQAYRIPQDKQDKYPYARMVIPIYSDSVLYGNMYIWEDAREISGVELSVIVSATSLIALDFVKKVSILEIENGQKLSFLEDLLSGDKKRIFAALRNAQYFNFNPKEEHQIVLIRLLDINPELSRTETKMYRFNTNFSPMLQRLAKETNLKFLSIIQFDSVVLLCESFYSNNGMDVELLEQFLSKLTAHLKYENLLDMVAIGVGRAYSKPSGLKQSMIEAGRAVSCAGFMQEKVIHYEKTGVYRLLTNESLRAESVAFYQEVLSNLLDYDNEKNTELVKTLETYFKCKGNLSRLAEELELHYNTAVYRMQRIRELLNQDLDCSEDLLNLQIALKIHHMINGN